MVFSASSSALFASLNGSKRTDWLLFGAFVGAILALLALGASVLRKSGLLASAQERGRAAQRLAHERLHDSLTGLPNRALSLDRTEHALDRMPRAGWPLPASALCLEMTESSVMSDPGVAKRALIQLRSLGVQLALDDFGVGQSSLEQLVHSLPVDILKLDRAFVADMAHTRERAVVAAVAPMAGDLGMAAIAEGVETAEQAAKLTALGYPLAQGYHFGRPAAAADFAAYLAAERGAPLAA